MEQEQQTTNPKQKAKPKLTKGGKKKNKREKRMTTLAATTAIQIIPMIHTTSTAKTEQAEPCYMCFNNYVSNPYCVVMPDCKHKFHMNCMWAYYTANKLKAIECPMCVGKAAAAATGVNSVVKAETKTVTETDQLFPPTLQKLLADLDVEVQKCTELILRARVTYSTIRWLREDDELLKIFYKLLDVYKEMSVHVTKANEIFGEIENRAEFSNANKSRKIRLNAMASTGILDPTVETDPQFETVRRVREAMLKIGNSNKTVYDKHLFNLSKRKVNPHKEVMLKELALVKFVKAKYVK